MNQSRDEREFVNNQHLCKYFFKFFFSELCVKVLITIKSLDKEKEEAIKEILTQEFQSYLKFNDHSGDNLALAMKSFTDHLMKVYWVQLGTVGMGSIFIILECPTL